MSALWVFSQALYLDPRLTFVFKVLPYVLMCPKRVIYSRLGTGGCPRNLGGVSDFVLGAGN